MEMKNSARDCVVAKGLEAVHLTCVYCNKRQVIHVFHERNLRGALLWECLECQQRVRPDAGRSRRYQSEGDEDGEPEYTFTKIAV